jgi:putative ABC transport system permease protein
MHPLHKKAWRDVLHLRGQLLAILLVVAAGEALFVTLRSMHGYLVGARDDYYRSHRFAQVFAHLERAPESLALRIAAIPGVAVTETRVVAEVLLDVPGLAEPASARLVSVPAHGAPALNRLELQSGRWVTAERAGEVIASAAFARANRLTVGDRLGAVINGRWQELRLVGTAISPEYVYEIRGGADLFPDNRRFGVLWMSRPALATAFDLTGSFNDVTLRLTPGAGERQVIAELDRLLQRYGGLGAYDRSEHLSHRFLSDEIAETRVTSLLLPGIFLGITAFLLHFAMSRLVSQQRDQLAVLKAFGYRNGQVARHYLELALVPVGLGTIAGSALGLWLAYALAGVYARFFQFPDARFVPPAGVMLVAVAVAGGATLLGALGAVRRALALPPAEAMRPEAPATFRTSLLERSSLGKRLSLPARIVARHLHRQPWKAALAVLGTSLAVAIVFTGQNLWDAVDVLKEVQFERVQRQHLLLTFRRPLAPAVGHALAQLPGVLRVEALRAVPVELRNGHRRQRAAVMALDRDSELWRIVDRAGSVHALPANGALLTSALADSLAVRPGDLGYMAVLEGQRRTHRVRVAALADEMIGTSVYLERAAAHRLLGESARWSGAFLRIDTLLEPALLARLARLQPVSSVAVLRSVVDSFESTLEENFTISILALVGFACVIAVGIVYNGARIALSERGRELASLRVLGFSRQQVAAMLLGEQGALLLMAMPLGIGLGIALCALVVRRFSTDLFRLPLVVLGSTILLALAVVLAAALGSAWMVRRRIYRLDLIAVLKTRE